MARSGRPAQGSMSLREALRQRGIAPEADGRVCVYVPIVTRSNEAVSEALAPLRDQRDRRYLTLAAVEDRAISAEVFRAIVAPAPNDLTGALRVDYRDL